MKTLAIAYRIYPKISKVPAIFPYDKYRLSELCLRSFVNALDGIDFKVWAILDNCPEEYIRLFEKYIPSEKLEFILLKPTGNAATFGIQLDILSKQDFSENVYFAEDDYFYLPNALSEAIEFLNESLAGFVTMYDHIDYYNHPLHGYKSKIRLFGNRHWRTSGSTCMTFLTTKSTLLKTHKVLKSYTRKNDDASLWFTLTKYNIFNPALFIKQLEAKNGYFKFFLKAWLHTPIYNLFGEKMELYSPMPALATHLDLPHLAPGIDWQHEFQKFI